MDKLDEILKELKSHSKQFEEIKTDIKDIKFMMNEGLYKDLTKLENRVDKLEQDKKAI